MCPSRVARVNLSGHCALRVTGYQGGLISSDVYDTIVLLGRAGGRNIHTANVPNAYLTRGAARVAVQAPPMTFRA